MKKQFLSLLLAVATLSATASTLDYDNRFNFYLISDSGRNGYYEQKSVARTMGEMTNEIEPEFIVTAGDTHHYNGIESTSDPIWWTNFESIYTHPELLTNWYAALGNHEYHGNTQAVIDYTKVSRRWQMPARYYSKSFEAEGVKMLLVMIDTPALIDKYRNNPEEYPDAEKQDMGAQLEWLESTLKAAQTEGYDWVLAVGHHPIYAYTPKSISEREDMQQRVDPLLRKYGVDAYFCGHIHNFQHIRKQGSEVDYIVNTAGSLARKVEPIEGTQFCAGVEGFSIISMDKTTLEIDMRDFHGTSIYRYIRVRN
ncbi:MAG: metallophosphoesterase [Rikenellaceae bacterium]